MFKAYMMTAAVLLAAGTCPAADRWTSVTAENTPGLPGNEIQFMSPATDGGVWIGTLNGATRYQKGTYSPVQDDKGKTLPLHAWCVLQMNGSFWLGHGSGALFGSGGTVRSTLGGHTVAPIIEVAPGDLWAIGKDSGGNGDKLFRYADGNWARVPGSENLRVVNMFLGKSGKLWLWLDGDGILEIDPAKGIAEAVHHLQGLNVTTAMADARGRIWCGLWGRGVAVWDGTGWVRYLAGEKSSAILAIRQDAKSNMWVATNDKGIWRQPFNKQEWVNDLSEEGAINLLATSSDGRVWVSSQMIGGLRYWDGQNWVVSLDDPLPIRCFLETDEGQLWAGGVLDGLHVLKK